MSVFRCIMCIVSAVAAVWSAAHAQDVDPQTATFTGATAVYSDTARHGPRTMLFGWGSGGVPQYRRLSDSLGINAVLWHSWYGLPDNTGHRLAEFAQMPDSVRLLVSNWHIEGATPSGYRHAIAVQFDPTVGNTVSGWNGFAPRTYDTSGAVFGFGYRHAIGIVPHDSVVVTADTSTNPVLLQMKENYNRYILFDADYRALGTGAPLLVLSGPQPGDQLINPMLTTDDVRRRQWAMLRNHGTDLAIRDAERYGNTWNWQDSVARGGDTTVFRARGDSTEWYLALNLRRWRNDDQDTVPDTTTVVSVKVPYTYRIDTVYYHTDVDATVNLFGADETVSQIMVIDDIGTGEATFTRYAVFDSAATQASDTLHHEHFGFMDNTLTSVNTTEFRVRKGMLPSPSSLIGTDLRPDVTLSSHFRLPRLARNEKWKLITEHWNIADTTYYNSDNPADVRLLLRYAQDSLPASGRVLDTVVVSVGMEVYYHGSVDVGIDHSRFESRLARQILRGHKDAVIRDRAQSFYTYLDTAIGAQARGMMLYRHYFMDEVPAPYWRVQRHVRRLLEQSLIIENDMRLTTHHVHLGGLEERWKGWFGLGLSSAPFIRYGSILSDTGASSYDAMSFRTMGLPKGYRGYHRWDDSSTLWPSGGAYDYEAHLDHISTSLYSAPDSVYRYVIQHNFWGSNLQALYEKALFDYIVEHPATLYGSGPLWTQLWPYSKLVMKQVPQHMLGAVPATPDGKVAVFEGRPHTGEELRYASSLALLLGASGLTYYCGPSFWTYGSGGVIRGLDIGVSRSYDPSSGASPAHQVRSDSLEGTDFLDPADSLLAFLHPQLMAAELGIDTTRFYIGTSSVRHVMKERHGWARENAPELLRLQLQAVLGKGYKLLANSRDMSVRIGDFVDTTVTGGSAEFRVRRIHDRYGNAWTGGDEYYRDSTFFVVTLLKDTAGSMDDVFYIGVLNRRTDPTVYYPAAGGTDLGDSVKFFSTVEFDSLVAGGFLDGLYDNPEYAQHGSREITVPLLIGVRESGAVVRIREVGGELHRISTVPEPIEGTSRYTVPVRLKPGEGKLLRVTIRRPDTRPGVSPPR